MTARWRDRAPRVAGPLLDTILPQTCCSCEAWIPAGYGPLCPDCAAALATTAALPYCPFCARTMAPPSIYDRECARCRSESFWNVRSIVRVGEYSEPALRRLLLGLKFVGHERQADLLGRLLADALRAAPWFGEIEALVPVPMHSLRRIQRPCDHAEALAEAAAHRLNIPVRRAAVRRVKYARSQICNSSRAERFRNVKDCFGPARRPDVAGRVVCLVDNLLVSGATIHEVSKVVRKLGAKTIYAAVAARSTLSTDSAVSADALEGMSLAQGRDG